MHKETKWFELVIHIDEDGTRATASTRTRTFEDDGTIDHAATKMESCTLAQLGAEFPWSEFIPEALQDALLTIGQHEATIAAEQAARQAKEQEADDLAAQVAAKDAELTDLKMPEEEKRRAAIQAEIDRLQAELT